MEANDDGEGIDKDFHSEDDVKSFTRNELLLRPKVRYCELSTIIDFPQIETIALDFVESFSNCFDMAID